MSRVLAAVGAMLLVSCQPTGRTAFHRTVPPRTCSSEATANEISATIRAFFEALARDDDTSVRSLTTDGFYAFDVGKRFTGPELSRLIAEAHRAGRVLQWNIGPIDARMDCNIAFATWENSGAVGTAQRLEPRAWLESALLVRQGNRWVIDFLHSTPKDPRP